MSFGNIFSVDVSAAFSGDSIGGIQSTIQTEYGIDDAHYPKIVKCDMRSADKFTVSFNRENLMEAVRMPSGEYGVHYEGGIDQIFFAEKTTLTWMQVEWAYAGKVAYPVLPVWEPDSGTSAVLGNAILGEMILGKE